MTLIDTPVADWFTLDELTADPYPVFERLRRETPVSWAPPFDRYFVARFDGCRFAESRGAPFVPDPASLVKRAIGTSMISKTDPAHATERRAINPTVQPRTINDSWRPVFQAHADRFAGELREAGPGADLDAHFAAPFSAANLGALLGLRGVDWRDVQRWSRAFITATGNIAGDPAVWEGNDQASREVDAAIDDLLPYYRAHPDASMLSSLADASVRMPLESIRANMKLAISGGFNEPEHVITSGIWSLDTHEDVRARVLTDGSLFDAVFTETVRWRPPINLLNRVAAEDVELGGVAIPAGARVGLLIGSANRDEMQFVHADRFDIDRPKRPHLAFGSGTYLCAGSWAARVSIAEVAWPTLYRTLPGLCVVDPGSVAFRGFAFRGLPSLDVTWGR